MSLIAAIGTLVTLSGVKKLQKWEAIRFKNIKRNQEK
jgi:hypothetical protein